MFSLSVPCPEFERAMHYVNLMSSQAIFVIYIYSMFSQAVPCLISEREMHDEWIKSM